MQFQTSCYEMQSKQKKYSDRNGGKVIKQGEKWKIKHKGLFIHGHVFQSSHTVSLLSIYSNVSFLKIQQLIAIFLGSLSLSLHFHVITVLYIFSREPKAHHILLLSPRSQISLSQNPKSQIRVRLSLSFS
jgi:hypothetical protein